MPNGCSHPIYCINPPTRSSYFFLHIIKHSFTFTSILLAILCSIVIIKSVSVSRGYARLLILLLVSPFSHTQIFPTELQFTATLFDVYSQWVLDPIFVSPLVCGYRGSPLINIPMGRGVCWVGFTFVHSVIHYFLGNLHIVANILWTSVHCVLSVSSPSELDSAFRHT